MTNMSKERMTNPTFNVCSKSQKNKKKKKKKEKKEKKKEKRRSQSRHC